MKRPLLFWIPISLTFLFIAGCQNASSEKSLTIKKEKTKDSLSILKKKNDSVAISNVSVKKYVKIGDKTVQVVKPPTLSKLIKFEIDGDLYRYREAERFQSFISTRITLSSKSKAEDPKTFFPKISLFLISKNNSYKRIGQLEFSLYRQTDRSIAYLEQLFDYQEQETFVCYKPVKVPISAKYWFL